MDSVLDSPVSDPPSRSAIRAAHRGVAAVFFFNGSLFGALASRIPAIKDANGLSEATLGLALLGIAAGALISFPIAGIVTGRVGAAWLSRAIIVLFTPPLMVIGLTSGFWQLAPVLFLFGFGFGAQDVAMNTWGAEVEKAAGRSIMSGLHGMFSLGAGLGAASGAVAAALAVGPLLHLSLWAVAIAAGAMVISNVAWDSEKTPPDRTKRKRVVPRGGLLLAGIVALVAFMSEGATADWSALYLVDIVGASESAAAIGFVAFSVAMVIGRFSGDGVIRTLGRSRTARLAGVLSLAGGVIVVTAVAPWMAWGGFAILGLGLSSVVPLAIARAAMDPHVAPGPAIAAVATFGYGGLLLGPPMMGFIAAATSLQASFGIIAGSMVLIVLFARAMEM